MKEAALEKPTSAAKELATLKRWTSRSRSAGQGGSSEKIEAKLQM
jgi:hypothetical protein